MDNRQSFQIIKKQSGIGRRYIDRWNYIRHKVVDRTKDSFFNFTHAHLIRNMVTAAELDLVKREPCDRNLVLVAFYPTGGFGDYIISSKLLDELLLRIPCRIDVYCENVVFGRAVYAARPGVQVLPYESLYGNRSMYDVVLCVEHFIHVWSWNAHHVAKIAPEFADQVRALGKSMEHVRPEIEQQWFREAMHFHRSQLLGINRWTELRYGSVFEIPDQYTYVPLRQACLKRVWELGLEHVRYLTLNRGADSMGRSGMQTKVWPQEYYEELAGLLKKRFPDLSIIQLGSKGNQEILAADQHLLGEDLEVTKWLLRGSLLHIDCEGGLVHLAVQLAVTCVVLFGPTPLPIYAYPQNINLVSEACAGCMGVHPDWAFSCYRGLKKPECMYTLTPARVMSAVDTYLSAALHTTRKKNITKISADAGQSIKQQGYYKCLYERCKKNNPLVTMQDTYMGLYAAVHTFCKTNHPHRIALIGAKRDFIGWYLQKRGCAVTEFDPDYGYRRRGDTSFNRFTEACRKQGMDMRLGDGLQIPYTSEYFDLVVLFQQNPWEKGYDREAERILKQDGCLIWNGKTGIE